MESVGDWSNAFLVALFFEDKSDINSCDSNLTLFVEYLVEPASGISNTTVLSIASNWYGYDVIDGNPITDAENNGCTFIEYNEAVAPFS